MQLLRMLRLAAVLLLSAPLLVGAPALGAAAAAPAPVKPAPVKTLHFILNDAEAGFDPATVRNQYSFYVLQAIFDRLYTYDYLARPVKVVPQAAAAMPEISADGKTYTIRLKKGVLFTQDPVFQGKPRELTMYDFVYSWKRLFDPQLASPHTWMFAGKIVGLDQFAAAAKQTGKIDYNANVAGLEVLDPYTLRLHLMHADFNLAMVMAHFPASAMAREVVEAYRDSKGEVAGHPVGSGFYMLGDWVRGSRIVLNENKLHLPEFWNFTAGSDPGDARIVAEMKGKRMPAVGRIELSVVAEDQTRWLAFQSGQADLLWLDGPLAPKALDRGKLRPELQARGVHLSRELDTEVLYYYFNLRDPVLGGMSKEKIALRRAIAMAHNIDEEIQIVWNGQAERLEYPIPQGVAGYDPHYKSLLQYDPVLANKLLDQFGYKKAADGWRTLPDGKPLVLHYTSVPDSRGLLQAQMWRKTYNAIGIRMVNDRMQFADMLQAEQACRIQSRAAPWVADFPDGDNFMQLFYGPNIHQNNNGCFHDPAYDTWYEASQRLPDGPERTALYHKMARQIEVDGGALMGYGRYRNMLAQKRVIGYKDHPTLLQVFQYIDIAPDGAAPAGGLAAGAAPAPR